MSTTGFSLQALYAFEEERRNQITLPLMWVDICGDHLVALVLAQILYWFGPSKKDGKSRCKATWNGRPCLVRKRHDFWDDCRISERQVDRVLAKLKKMGLIEWEIHKSPFYQNELALHIFLNEGKLGELVDKFRQSKLAPTLPNGEMDFTDPLNGLNANGEVLEVTQTVKCTIDTDISAEPSFNTSLNGKTPHPASQVRQKKPKIAFNFEKNVFEGISEDDKKLWLEANPGIEVNAEIASAIVWLKGNPQRKKRNWEKFLGNWMKNAGDKAQNRAIRQAQYGNSNATAQQDIKRQQLERYRANNGEFGSTNTIDFSKDD